MSEEKQVGGTYIILNILDCKVYVGQAKDFNERSHLSELYSGEDNENLQKDFDDQNKEFVYFYVGYISEKLDKRISENREIFDTYECLFINVMEDLGYELYNKNKPKFTEKALLPNAGYNDAVREIEEEFRFRFGMSATELLKANKEKRKAALNTYIDNYSKRKQGDILFASRNVIKSKIKSEISLISSGIDINEVFFSKAGHYVGENIDQILDKKKECIDEHGYCLWSFANNGVGVEKIRELCRERKKENNKDTYVLFSFTPSARYSKYDNTQYQYLNVNVLTADEFDFLKLNLSKTEDSKERYKINLECTGANKTSAAAFVITDLFLINEYINQVDLSKQYEAVGVDGTTYECFNEKGEFKFKQRSTYYLRSRNIGNKEIDAEKLCSDYEGRKFCFMAKLAAPYVIMLDAE